MSPSRITAIAVLLLNLGVAVLFRMGGDNMVGNYWPVLTMQTILAVALAISLWFHRAPPTFSVSMLEKSTFRAVAMLLFLLSLAEFALGLMGVLDPPPGKPIHIFLPPAAMTLTLAVGLWFHVRWAAALFIVASFAVALWLALGSIANVPLPWVILNLAFAVAICLPAVLMIRDWSQLQPRHDRT